MIGTRASTAAPGWAGRLPGGANDPWGNPPAAFSAQIEADYRFSE